MNKRKPIKYREIDREMAKAFSEYDGPVPEFPGSEFTYVPGQFSDQVGYREEIIQEIEHRLKAANRKRLRSVSKKRQE